MDNLLNTIFWVEIMTFAFLFIMQPVLGIIIFFTHIPLFMLYFTEKKALNEKRRKELEDL